MGGFIYVVMLDGVCWQGIKGASLDKAKANDLAYQAILDERDDYHDVIVLEVKLDERVEVGVGLYPTGEVTRFTRNGLRITQVST